MKKFKFFTLIVSLQILCTNNFLFAQLREKYLEQWNDPIIQQRIEDGIRQNRMGQFEILFQDDKGKPISVESVELVQVSHDFSFGANGFMVKGFKNEKEDALFEKYFTQLFNFATIPFYWPELGPQPGKLRFGKDSEYIPASCT